MMIRIQARDFPGRDCGPYHNIAVGLQRRDQPDQLVPADSDTAVFEAEVNVIEAASGYDFRGPHVQGRRGERFIYLTWGEHPDEATFVMFRRAKLHLSSIPAALISEALRAGALETTLGLTDEHGQPRCASVGASEIAWRALPVAV